MKRYLCLLLCRVIALPAQADNPEEAQLPVLDMTNRKQIAGKEIERFQAHVPNCRVAYKTSESTGATWREH
ncbi:MAG: hypothetical protein PUC00_03515 [Clostridiales bacterium]|nr:hypothetical protein [Clostridiales bacterium]